MTTSHIMIVQATFYKDIAELLLTGATDILKKADAKFQVFSVPGALEVPTTIAMGIDSTYNFDGYVALGCVIRGQTSHFDIVCRESARGIYQLALEHRVPIGNSILTCDNWDQALDRAMPAKGNKGGLAAQACLEMLKLKKLLCK